MAATLKGKGVVWGISTSSTGTFGSGAIINSVTFDVESDTAEVPNSIGDTVGMVFYNQRQRLTIEVVPSAATIADAKTANALPLPGTLVTIADSDDTELAGTQSGKYIFLSGAKNKSNTGVTTLTFNLIQFVDNDVSGTIAS